MFNKYVIKLWKIIWNSTFHSNLKPLYGDWENIVCDSHSLMQYNILWGMFSFIQWLTQTEYLRASSLMFVTAQSQISSLDHNSLSS